MAAGAIGEIGAYSVDSSVKSPFVADMVRGWASGILLATLLYLAIVWPLFGISGVVDNVFVLIFVAALLPVFDLFVMATFIPRAVSASSDSFAIVRYSSRGSGLQVYDWSDLEAAAKPTWTPMTGRRYPIRIIHGAGFGVSRYALTREQAEALAVFPGGASLRRLLT